VGSELGAHEPDHHVRQLRAGRPASAGRARAQCRIGKAIAGRGLATACDDGLGNSRGSGQGVKYQAQTDASFGPSTHWPGHTLKLVVCEAPHIIFVRRGRKSAESSMRHSLFEGPPPRGGVAASRILALRRGIEETMPDLHHFDSPTRPPGAHKAPETERLAGMARRALLSTKSLGQSRRKDAGCCGASRTCAASFSINPSTFKSAEPCSELHPPARSGELPSLTL